MRTFLEHLTTAELIERLAKLQASGERAKAKIGTSEDRVGSPYISKGQWMQGTVCQEALNGCRGAWKTTRQEIMSRFIPA